MLIYRKELLRLGHFRTPGKVKKKKKKKLQKAINFTDNQLSSPQKAGEVHVRTCCNFYLKVFVYFPGHNFMLHYRSKCITSISIIGTSLIIYPFNY